MAAIRLGLIGDNIARSQSPRLHALAGGLTGLDISYERLIPIDLGQDFAAVFDRCAADGFAGINVTYPYKETVVSRLTVEDPAIAAIGACNTVVFGGTRPRGYNTDYTGFMHGFRETFGAATPGAVAMAGAGGVGKAVAFGLAGLGCDRIHLFDPDAAKATALQAALTRAGFATRIDIAPSVEAAVDGVDGLINCTPLGMVGHPGTAIPATSITRQRWAFDAVYTPVETQFLVDARAAGLSIMSGYELFFHQGVDAFRIFTGADIDTERLRAALLEPDPSLRKTA